MSKTFVFISGILLLMLVGAVDTVSGFEVSLSLFYVVPVAWIGWRCGIRSGALSAFAAAVVWFAADYLIGHHPYTSVWIPYWNTLIRFGFFILVVTVLVELKKALLREKDFARRDFSTGIANTKAFYEYAAIEIVRSRRYHHPLAIVYLDCDDFKSVNDSFGHYVGDRLLRTVGQTIQRSVRKSDLVARLGGDEFAVLFPETESGTAYKVVRKLRAELLETMKTNGWGVTFSFGLVTFTTPPDSVDELIQIADSFMYSAKRTGKNKINQNNDVKPPSLRNPSFVS